MCILPQIGATYETREGYQAIVVKKAVGGFQGFVKKFDGQNVEVLWHENGHYNDDNAPHEFDLESEPVTLPQVRMTISIPH